MQIGAINNTSFSGKAKLTEEEKAAERAAKAEKRQQAKTQYFKYLSKMEVNDALMLSKGREEENGKFKLAGAAAKLGAIITGGAAAMSAVAGLKGGNLNKVAKLAMTALAFATAAEVTDSINSHRAQKTANERGFYTDRQIQYPEGKKYSERLGNVYDLVDNTYDKHTAGSNTSEVAAEPQAEVEPEAESEE